MAAPDARRGNAGEGIELPSPTAWPMIFALGLSLLFAGLVTDVAVSVVGIALFVCGAAGWWFEVLPHERHERVPPQSPAERPPPVQARAAGVEHRRVREDQHRLQLPVEMQPYSSGLRGGAAGAVSMALVAMAYGLVAQHSAWYPINLLASAVLPSLDAADIEQLRAFDATALGVATIMHGGLSLLVGLVYAALLPALPGRTLLWGGLVAPVAWSAVVWVSLGVVAPALSEHIQWGWFIASQATFGLTAGWVVLRAEPVRIPQRVPFADRIGIEQSAGPAPGTGGDEGDGT
jgi:hypothetical protein